MIFIIFVVMFSAAQNNAERAALLRRLSGLWYAAGYIPVAGDVAVQAALTENTDAAWSVAGGTFFNGLTASQDPKIRDYCAESAVKCLFLYPSHAIINQTNSLPWSKKRHANMHQLYNAPCMVGA